MPVDWKVWSPRLFVVLCVLGLVYLCVAMFAADAHYKADTVNRSTISTFGLPVDVTRTIRGDETEFVLTQRGDELGVFYTYGNRVDQSYSMSVNVSARDMWWTWPYDAAWPTVDLKIVRRNCTDETYSLPTRGGAVRGCA